MTLRDSRHGFEGHVISIHLAGFPYWPHGDLQNNFKTKQVICSCARVVARMKISLLNVCRYPPVKRSPTKSSYMLHVNPEMIDKQQEISCPLGKLSPVVPTVRQNSEGLNKTSCTVLTVK